MSEQPEISDEAIRVAAEAIEDKAILHFGRDLGTVHRDEIVRAGLEAAYPLLRKQWEAELSECDEVIQLPVFFEGQPHPYVRCVRKPLGHPMPHRSEDGTQWSPVTEAPDA